jgi:hypothetical protein
VPGASQCLDHERDAQPFDEPDRPTAALRLPLYGGLSRSLGFSPRITKLNYRKKTMSTINGIGFKFIGQSDPKRDGSYIATKWFCLVFPLIPAGSYRIWPGDHKSYALGMYSSSTFQLKPVGLYLPHVFKIYGMYLAFYLFIVVADRIGSGSWHFK